MKRYFAFALMIVSVSCFSDVQQLNTVPSSWKLENYFGDNVVVWFSGSVCTNGKLSLPSTATDQDKNRFWSLILAAKTAKTEVFIRYEDTSSSCDVVSFGTFS